MSAIMTLAAVRLIRGWNQTGQKFAGDPDIVKLILFKNPQLLWLMVGVMYIVVSFHIIQHLDRIPIVVVTGITSVLVSSAFAFKLAFTAEDAPELVTGLAKMLHDHFDGQTLLIRARVVFGVLFVLACIGVYNALTGGRRAAYSAGKSHLPTAPDLNIIVTDLFQRNFYTSFILSWRSLNHA